MNAKKLSAEGRLAGILRSQEAYTNHMQIRCEPAPALYCVVSCFLQQGGSCVVQQSWQTVSLRP